MSVKALILAAGKGERLRPLTESRPKALLPLLGKPLLEYAVRDSADLGLADQIIVTGYKAEMIKDYFGDGTRYGARITYADQNPGKLTGEAEAILAAEPMLRAEPFFLMIEGDVVAGKGIIANTVKAGLDSNAEITAALTRVEDARQHAMVRMDGENRIRELVEKPTAWEAPSSLAISSVYLFKPSIFDVLHRVGHLERAMAEMIRSGARACGTIWAGDWLDVGYPQDVLAANRILLDRKFSETRNGIVCKSPIPLSVKVQAPAYIGERVTVMENSTIRRAYIDDDATVGTNSLVHEYSYVGKRAAIGFATEVKNSVVMSRTALGPLSCVSDSVIGENCELGAGVITVSARFGHRNIQIMIDGKLHDTGVSKFGAVVGDNAKVGVHVSIYPGRKIGAGSWVDSNTTVASDVPSGVRLSARSAATMREKDDIA